MEPEHCPHDGVEVLDEDWWFCRDCGDAGPYAHPIRRTEILPVTTGRRQYVEPVARSSGKRYYCPGCGQVLTVWAKCPPGRVPIHPRWLDGRPATCAASQRPGALETAP